jgi:Cu2+-exporting ATPase
MQGQIAHSVLGRLRVRYPAAWLAPRRAAFEARLAAVPGVRAVRASPLTGSVRVDYDPRGLSAAALVRSIDAVARTARASPAIVNGHAARAAGARGRRPDGSLPAVIGATAVLATAWLPVAPPIKAGLVVAWSVPTVLRAVRSVATTRTLTGDLLEAVALGLLVARRQWPAAALLAWFRSLGALVLAGTLRRTRRSLRDVVMPADRMATRVEGSRRVAVPIHDITVGDLVLVAGGQSLPVDGIVVRGEALVNQQTMTGEGLPAERRPGDHVFMGTVVEDGEITVRVDQVGLDTAIGRIVAAVEAAADEPSEIERFAEDLADRQVGRSAGLAALGTAVARSLDAGIAILVADYGMAARVGIPAALLSAIARASRRAIVIKGTPALEGLARVDTVVFDKTGTLTSGTPGVSRVVTYPGPWSEHDVIRLAAAAERGFPHPVARAIARLAADHAIDVPERDTVRRGAGLGVDAMVGTERVLVGGRRFMESEEIALGPAAGDEAAAHAAGGSPTFVAIAGRLAGQLVLQDELRADASELLQALRDRGFERVIMVSGDNTEATRAIAGSLGLADYRAEMLPEDKAALVRNLRDGGRVVAMIGDGVNDALAMREADVGIAVTGGPELVAAAADVVLMEGGLDGVAWAIDLARGAVADVQRVVAWAARANLAVVALCSLGLARPVATILLSRGAALAAALAPSVHENVG